MKRLELIELHLKNFKGLDRFSLITNGSNVNIYGDNGTGKTTIFDAFIWLLFGRDSLNRTTFEIKTLNKEGEVKTHELEHEVEGVFLLDGEELTLKRQYLEKWTKKKNAIKKTMTGHVTKYFINGVPKKKNEYDETIKSIITDDTFKLLTNPLYFNESIGWKARREILLNIGGDITDAEVIETIRKKEEKRIRSKLNGIKVENLEDLLAKLNGMSLDDYRLMIDTKRKQLARELDTIPIRIDEITLSIPDTDADPEELEQEVKALAADIEEKTRKIHDMKSGGDLSQKRKALSDIDLELSVAKNEQQHEGMTRRYQIEASIQENRSNIDLLRNNSEHQDQLITRNMDAIEQLQEQVADLRDKWRATAGEEFTYEPSCTCPTCKQEIPEEQVEAARQEALNQFNMKKAQALEGIQKDGERINQQIEEIQTTNERIRNKNEELEKEIKRKESKVESLQLKLQAIDAYTNKENDERLKVLNERRERILKDIEDAEISVDGAIATLDREIHEQNEKKRKLERQISELQDVKRQQERIRELEEKEGEIIGEMEEIEYDLYLIDEFTKEKVRLLEDRISDKFTLARFKLFDRTLDDGIKEICETTYNGVPFNSGLNNAMKINIGIDILNTLQEHYGITVPIFIDNSESVTSLIDTPAQVIRLVVSEDHKQLEVEPETETQTA